MSLTAWVSAWSDPTAPLFETTACAWLRISSFLKSFLLKLSSSEESLILHSFSQLYCPNERSILRGIIGGFVDRGCLSRKKSRHRILPHL